MGTICASMRKEKRGQPDPIEWGLSERQRQKAECLILPGKQAWLRKSCKVMLERHVGLFIYSRFLRACYVSRQRGSRDK